MRAGGLAPSVSIPPSTGSSAAWTRSPTPAASAGSKKKVDGNIQAFLLDVIGSWSAGPLLLESRGVYSSGNKARDSIPQGKHYFEPLDTDTGY